MTETTLALCKSAFPGILMWLLGLCASNQALEAPLVDLSKGGEIFRQEISAPMDERYEFGLQFKFQNREAYEKSINAGKPSVSNPAACNDGSIYAALSPEIRRETGAALDVEVSISSTDGKVQNSHRFQSRCLQSWSDLTKSRQFGYLDIGKGKHIITVVNHSPISAEAGVGTTLFLTGIGAGYP